MKVHITQLEKAEMLTQPRPPPAAAVGHECVISARSSKVGYFREESLPSEVIYLGILVCGHEVVTWWTGLMV